MSDPERDSKWRTSSNASLHEQSFSNPAADPRNLQSSIRRYKVECDDQAMSTRSVCLNDYYQSPYSRTGPFTSSLITTAPRPAFLFYPPSSQHTIIPCNSQNNFDPQASQVVPMPMIQRGLFQAGTSEREHLFPTGLYNAMENAKPLSQEVQNARTLSSLRNKGCHPLDDHCAASTVNRDQVISDEQLAPGHAVTDRPSTSLATQAVDTESSLIKKPKRPLSAYNIFFKDERAAMVQDAERNLADSDTHLDNDAGNRGCAKRRKKRHGIPFEQMAQIIGKKWKNIDPHLLGEYEKRAVDDKKRYQAERELYMQQERSRLEMVRQDLESKVSEETMTLYLNNTPNLKRKIH